MCSILLNQKKAKQKPIAGNVEETSFIKDCKKLYKPKSKKSNRKSLVFNRYNYLSITNSHLERNFYRQQ